MKSTVKYYAKRIFIFALILFIIALVYAAVAYILNGYSVRTNILPDNASQAERRDEERADKFTSGGLRGTFVKVPL